VRPQPLYTDEIFKMQATLGLNEKYFLLQKWGRLAAALMLPSRFIDGTLIKH
jgi:hypothetical protein